MQLNRTPNALTKTDRDNMNKNWTALEEEINRLGPAPALAELARRAAEQANAKTENVQKQLNKIVVEGDSSPQATQASIGADGTDYDGNLKARLDTEFNVTAGQLAETEGRIDYLIEQGYGGASIAQDVFSASGSIVKAYSVLMNSISILNIGNNELIVKIDNTQIPVPSKIGYNGFFNHFGIIEIIASTPFEMVVRGTGDKRIITDTFSKTTFGTTNTGEIYTLGGALENPVWDTATGKATVTNAVGNSETYAVINTNSSDASIKSKMTMTRAGTPDYPGLVMRYADDNNRLLLRGDDTTGATGFKLLIRKLGAWTTLHTFQFPIVRDSTYNVEAIISNGVVEVKVDGKSIGKYTLTSDQQTSTQNGKGFGIMVKQLGSSHDNLTIYPIIGGNQ